MIDSVLASASRGWHLFPLSPMSKIPLIAKTDWKDIATTDEEQIREWWTKWPDANYGIATGASNLVVIDIDVCKEPLTDGETSIRKLYGIEAWCWLVLNAGLSKEPATFEVWTPSGGEHLYFKANEAFQVKNSASKVGLGIDVRADGGYVVGPGSKTNQGTYEIRTSINPKPLPSWLRTLLAQSRAATTPVQESARDKRQRERRISDSDGYAAGALKGEVATIKATPIGAGLRNNQLNVSAFKLKKFVDAGQLNGHDVADELMSAARSIQMDAREAANTIKSGLGV